MTRKAAIIGGGVIGGGWTARFLLMGWDVAVFDPDPKAEDTVRGVVDKARPALASLYDTALPASGTLSFHDTMSSAVEGAEWIQESVPERLPLKQKVYQALQQVCPQGAVIGSSTSGFTPSELQSCAARPGQIVVTHPFVPVYLLPLVEVVGGDNVAPETIDRTREIMTSIGMYPLVVRKEIGAHIADRFLEAVWREALWLVNDGIATTTEVDEAIRMGFGLRWAQKGLFETYRIGGGAGGMRHFLEQFGPTLAFEWTKLMDVPDWNDDLIGRITSQSDDQSAGKSIATLEAERDLNLVAILRALKANGQAAGAHLRKVEARLDPLPGSVDDIADLSEPIVTVDRTVPTDWTDYNGHMNEARYLQAFGDATDRFMLIIGCDDEYIASGGSYFTAETHIRHLAEVRAGQPVKVTTQCLDGAGKKMHVFHRMWSGDELIATGEHLLLHVSLQTRRTAPPADHVAGAIGRIAEAHAALGLPEGAGRAVGAPRD